MPDHSLVLPGERFPSKLDRYTSRALARQASTTALELLAVDHVELVERAKVRAVGSVTREAISEAERIADDVMACQQQNPLATHLAADLAMTGTKALKERIERANRRLG